MSDYKTELLDIRRGLDAATARANAYTDPNLTAEGLAARRAEMVATARQAAGPVLEQLRTAAARDAAAYAGRVQQELPQPGTDADSTARYAARWSALAPLLAAGKSLRDVLETADAETAHAVRAYGPAFNEAASYRPGEPGLSAPDHGPLLRAVDARLAALSGPDAVAALAAAHEAAAVAAGVEMAGKHMADLIAGTATGMSRMDASLAAHYAEQGARQGLTADTRGGAA